MYLQFPFNKCKFYIGDTENRVDVPSPVPHTENIARKRGYNELRKALEMTKRRRDAFEKEKEKKEKEAQKEQERKEQEILKMRRRTRSERRPGP